MLFLIKISLSITKSYNNIKKLYFKNAKNNSTISVRGGNAMKSINKKVVVETKKVTASNASCHYHA